MHIPVIVDPKDISGITPAHLESSIQCICGNYVRTGDTIAVWVLKAGNEEECWLPACCEDCILARIAMGRC
jgi:hypothetical protein